MSRPAPASATSPVAARDPTVSVPVKSTSTGVRALSAVSSPSTTRPAPVNARFAPVVFSSDRTVSSLPTIRSAAAPNV